MPKFSVLPGVALLCALTACSDSSDNPPTAPEPPVVEPTFTYNAEVRRTEFGIPHIKAEDWGGLGYGYGYAYAQDNYCVTMREVALTSGRWAEFTGENVERDLLWRHINGTKEEFSERFFERLPQRDRDLVAGFAAGMSRYLEETGVDGLPEGENGCRGEPWVFAFDDIDLMIYLRRIALQLSTDLSLVRDAILAVRSPTGDDMASALGVQPGLRGDLQQLGADIRPSEVGSNAITLGAEATQNGGGLLLGNPHQPWNGSGRWYEAHLTIPGEYDVAGASLQGLPWIGIGFTRDVAWTHTVDFANRFTLYEVTLNPDDLMQYDYDGQWQNIEANTVQAQRLLEDGSLETIERTFYSTRYGLLVDLGGVNPALGGWPTFAGTVFSMRDANLETGFRSLTQWVEKAQATNMEEYREALRFMGNPIFHEFAADRDGNMFYGQISAVPHVTTEKIDDCMTGLGGLIAQATTNAIIGLDGSRSACEWGEDADTPEGTNLFGLEAHPQILGRGAAGNANNSYWLSDPNNPLEGFPVVMGWLGAERTQQFLRTRITHQMIAERLAGTDGLSETPLFDFETLKSVMYLNRVHAAEVTLDDVLDICAAYVAEPPQDSSDADVEKLTATCDVLANWDRKVDVDSRGAQVFTEFWGGIRDEFGSPFQSVVVSDTFWAEPFDPDNPLETPRGIDTSLEANREVVIEKLLRAYQRLDEANVALDAPWGEVQFLERNGEPVPIHGGSGNMGVFGAISASLTEGGYRNPRAGNSYIQVVTWEESECPIADTILTHSQSVQPSSEFYGDQTRLYADKRWVRFPFCEEDIVANQVGETLILQGD
ncbi:MAG: penicillin acylase family protein [Pseudomonadota bacterium]